MADSSGLRRRHPSKGGEMTREEIMALANQTAGQHWMDEAHIQRFAALVAEAEREACARVAEMSPDKHYCAAVIRARGEKK